MSRSTSLFIVRYRRDAWEWHRTRLYLSEWPARQLIAKLLADDWIDLTPIVFVELTRHALGEEEMVEEWTSRRWRR